MMRFQAFRIAVFLLFISTNVLNNPSAYSQEIPDQGNAFKLDEILQIVQEIQKKLEILEQNQIQLLEENKQLKIWIRRN